MAEPGTPSQASQPARLAAMRVVSHLRGQGHEAYFAGGCVRDELLGLEPGDYDVATDATPDRLASLFHGARLVGAKFGVVQVRKLGVWTEVATFRSDGSYTDRRRPDEVTFSDAQSDAERRDFTINALFLDPLADAADRTPRSDGQVVGGRVIDLVGGLADLEAGVVRAVGDPHRRLAEDHLRALRAVRFAARLGFEIDPQTAHAIAEQSGQLEGISRERIGAELRRMLGHPTRARAVAMLETLALDGPTLEERPSGAGQRHPVLAGLPEDASPMLALAGWSLDRGHAREARSVQPLCDRLRTALCLSNDEHAALAGCLTRRLDILERFWGLDKAGQKRLAASAEFRAGWELVRTEDLAMADRVASRTADLASEPGGLSPVPWITGNDLVQNGWRPGPAFGRILDILYDLQLSGRAQDRAALLEHLATLNVKDLGSAPIDEAGRGSVD
jgi:hypothetical protein